MISGTNARTMNGTHFSRIGKDGHDGHDGHGLPIAAFIGHCGHAFDDPLPIYAYLCFVYVNTGYFSSVCPKIAAVSYKSVVCALSIAAQTSKICCMSCY